VQPGTLLADRYRLEAVLATGGMGVVHAATDLAAGGRPVAIKILKKELLAEPRFVERLRREARAASSLAHPNIVEVTDLVVEPDRAFLVMERLEGQAFGMAITESTSGMDAETVVTIGRQLLSALEAAHRAGLVHRDVKPDNVFLVEPTPQRPVLIAKLLDFGLVKLETADRLTATHSVLGTWQYMAPEQARGERTDGRSDVYALGACLYYALTKKRPYQAADMEAATFALSEQPAPPLRSQRPGVDPALAAVIERALSKSVLERYQSAREMRDALAPWGLPDPAPIDQEDDDIQTRPVKESVLGRHAKAPRPPASLTTATASSAEELGDISTGEILDTRERTLENTLENTLDRDTKTTPRAPASRDPQATVVDPRPEPEPSSDRRPPTIEPEPESDRALLLQAATPIALPDAPSAHRRPAPSRHRWRPPQKLRAALVVPGTDDPVVYESRRPSIAILAALAVGLFIIGLALGRLILG
jgi:serine/threonine-protein kinase